MARVIAGFQRHFAECVPGHWRKDNLIIILTWEILNVGLNFLFHVVSTYNFQIKFVWNIWV